MWELTISAQFSSLHYLHSCGGTAMEGKQRLQHTFSSESISVIDKIKKVAIG